MILSEAFFSASINYKCHDHIHQYGYQAIQRIGGGNISASILTLQEGLHTECGWSGHVADHCKVQKKMIPYYVMYCQQHSPGS